MMISPETFASENRDRTYRELLEVREELLGSLRAFERGDTDPEEWRRMPSPDTVYQMELEYLAQVCGLLEEKYREEREREEEEKAPLVTVTTVPARGPGQVRAEVYDSGRAYALVRVTRDCPPEKEEVLPLSLPDLRAFRRLMREPSLREKPEKQGFVGESGIIVMDGVRTEVRIRFGDGERRFCYENLDEYAGCLDGYPQTRTVLELISLIRRAAGE